MFKKLWQLLMLYLVLGVADGEKPGGEAEQDGASEGEGEGDEADGEEQSTEGDGGLDDDLDSLIETVEAGGDMGAKGGGRENAAIRDARKRAQDAEEARIRAEAALEAERNQRRNAQPTDDQRLWEAEEAKLRDPDASDMEKWQVKSNRIIRQSQMSANQALSTAADMRDATDFDRLATSNPKVYSAYKDRVEKARAEWASKNVFPPRRELLKILLGGDILDGKVKPGTRKKAAAEATERTSGVDRGRSPGARSDVVGKGRLTEQQKRAERLKGVHI